MKNIKLLLISLVVAFALAGCSKSSQDTPGPDVGKGSVIGEWHMISWSTLTAADIYLSLTNEGTFELYQRLYTPNYIHLKGSYLFDKQILSGKYSDNKSWGSSYKISFNSVGTKMTLTSIANADDVSVFVQATIPTEIISGVLKASTSQSRRSEDTLRFL